MAQELRHLAEVRAGYPFRGSVPAVDGGPALAVQMRDLDPLDGVDWSGVTRTRLEGRRQPDWLQQGDILFVTRGAHTFAICLDEVPAPAVCSQYFFLLRVRDTSMLLPEFLAWQINQQPAQRYLNKNAEGTDQRSIRRGVLEALPIAVPAIAEQEHLIGLAKAARQERAALEQLIRNRERQLHLIVNDILSRDLPDSLS